MKFFKAGTHPKLHNGKGGSAIDVKFDATVFSIDTKKNTSDGFFSKIHFIYKAEIIFILIGFTSTDCV